MLNDPVQSIQLAQVQLPEPAVCSIYLQATLVSTFDPADTVQAFTLNLTEGIGRVAVPRQMSFIGQPAIGAPLELTIPFIPLHALQVNITAVGLFTSGTPEIVIETYLILSPLTRIAEPEQKLDFGMATAGEADSLDDEMREELQAEAPSVEQMMREEAGETLEGGEGDDDDEPEPSWQMRLARALTERYGRTPTPLEFRRAVRQLRSRQSRRRGRFG